MRPAARKAAQITAWSAVGDALYPIETVQHVADPGVVGQRPADIEERHRASGKDPELLEILDAVGEQPGSDHHEEAAHDREEAARG